MPWAMSFWAFSPFLNRMREFSLLRLTCSSKEAFLDGRQDVSEITSGRSICYVVMRLLLRRDVGNATSGCNFCCIVGGFSIKSIENH